MQIGPEDIGLPRADLAAAHTPITGLLKPDLAALIEQLNPADAVTLLDVAASDLTKLVQILQSVETQTAADQSQAPQVTVIAKLNAEIKLDQAEQAIDLAGGRKLTQWETTPQTLLHIGQRLYNAGGHANYVRAAALAETIQSAYWGATLIHDQTASPVRVSFRKEWGFPRTRAFATASFKKLPERIRLLWRRAPLLVLLLAWLAVGIFGGILFSGFGFEFWALGFLALVGFGFYRTIRK
jgi:hypothetical protein